MLIAQDRNGYYRLIGTKEHPLEFDFEDETGRSPSDRNEMNFSFEGEQTHPAYFYGAAIRQADLIEIPEAQNTEEVTARVTEDGIYIRILEDDTI